MDVSPLSRGAKFELLSHPLQVSIRFFHHPNPTHSTACLAAHLPPDTERRMYGVSEFRNDDKSDLGSAYLPVVVCQRIPRCKRDIQLRTFWSKPVSDIWLLAVDGIYQQFTFVNHITQPSTSPAVSLAGSALLPHGRAHRFLGVTLSGSFAPSHY